jgi:hypothetical protein
MTEIPDNSKNINYKLFVLDPLSVIIQLAIISTKPIGPKFRIHDNVMYLQEPGYFQSICRIYYNTNKTEIQYLYNPIHFACEKFLSMQFTEKTPSIKKLFSCAKQGLEKLKETYKLCPIIVLCLNLYINLIDNSLDESGFEIFKKDAMTSMYTVTILRNLQTFWSCDRIKVVLDMIEFLSKDYSASNNVQSLAIFISNIDKETAKLVIKS